MLPASTRAQLLDDALNLARAGILDYELALIMTRYLGTKEYHYVPWKTFENAKFLDRMLRDTTEYGWFQTYIIKTLTSVKNILGFNTTTRETQLQTLLRPGALTWLSKMGDPAVVGWAKDLFQQWTRSPTPDTKNPIPLDVRSVVYCTAGMSGGRLEWEFVFERFLAATDRPTCSDELLTSLTWSRQEWLLITLLEKSLNNSEGIRLQDAVTVWNNMPRAAISSRVAFSYIRKSCSSLFERFGKDEFLIGNILQGAISVLATEVDLKDVAVVPASQVPRWCEQSFSNQPARRCMLRLKSRQKLPVFGLQLFWRVLYACY
jgi:aminopeptidase N